MNSKHQNLSLWRNLALILLFGIAAPNSLPQSRVPHKAPVMVLNPGYKLLIDPEKGTIESLRATFGVDRDLLITGHSRLPLFKIEFLNENSQFRTVTSSEAQTVNVRRTGNADEQTLTLEYKEIGRLPVDARVTVRCPINETLTYWNLEVSNRTTMWIGHIQFPVIEVPFDHAGDRSYSRILWSFADGALSGPVEPSMPVGPWGGQEHDTPEVWRYNNYPGQWTSTQLMAYYNDAGGLYVACDDPTGLPKFIDPLLENDGVTMGLGHYPGTRGPGEVKMSYNVVLGTFHGDWHAAAEIYRNWASKQSFLPKKLAERIDYPKWITERAVGITFPMRGQGDWDPPAKVNPEYDPATNSLPYLDRLSSALNSPLMPIIFNWEKGGPWVQPDAFPPLGGEVDMQAFMSKSRAKGWHPVIYGDGFFWVIRQKNTGYDGMPYFESHDGEASAVRKPDGSKLELPLADWRKSYVACVGTPGGRRMVLDMTRRMAEFGPSVIQQFDQGPGPFACYAKNHGHPPVPGPWMREEFNRLLQDDIKNARSVDPDVVMSSEGAPPETYLKDFPIWDSRPRNCPLYSFLYHEYGNGHEGFYTNRVSDEALRGSAARSLVNGYIVNFTLRDKGLIEYDWDQLWTGAVPDQPAILDWARRISRFRAGIARDFLVYGRMLRPWTVSGVRERDFGAGQESLVPSATWQAPDGRMGVVLANYSDQIEYPRIEVPGRERKTVTLFIDDQKSEQTLDLPSVVNLEMQPRSLALVELKPE